LNFCSDSCIFALPPKNLPLPGCLFEKKYLYRATTAVAVAVGAAVAPPWTSLLPSK
jgi:hypothetical protein